MKLEEEIQQKEFKNDYHKAYVNVLYTSNWLDSQSKDFFDRFDLTPQQFNVLRILRGKFPEPARVSYIRERMIDKMCDASRIIERLRLKKLVERKTCKSDRRSADVVISSKGQGLLFAIDNEIHKLDNVMLKLNETEIEQLNNILDKLRG